MKNIIRNSNDKFTLKPIQINKQITEKLDIINPKYNNIRQNIYNHKKKIFHKIRNLLMILKEKIQNI